jgi:hypothetical protein
VSTGVDSGGVGPRPAPPHPGFVSQRRHPIPPPASAYPPPEAHPGQAPPGRHGPPGPPYSPRSEAPWSEASGAGAGDPEPWGPPAWAAEPPDRDPAPGHHAASPRPRSAAAALCLVLGLGLLGGAAAGEWINHEPGTPQLTAAEQSARTFGLSRGLWHSTPVSTFFPATLHSAAAGPGGAARTWTRVGVAPAGNCADAFDPLLAKVLAPAGCVRLLRATYTDATSSSVTTVGLLVTSTDAAGMRKLSARWSSQHLDSRADLIPRSVAFAGTPAAGFGDKQRASWTVGIATDLPVIVYAVSGFADGRAVPVPQPVSAATAKGATTAPGQSGLGNDALALANSLGTRARAAAESLTVTSSGAPR